MTAKQLTDSILQMAIQGKLVPQDPNDEPASVLLERIREKKKRMVKEKLLKKTALAETEINADDIPFDIPESWVWTTISNIFTINPKVIGKDNDNAAFIPMEKIDAGYSSSFTYEVKKWKEIKSSYTNFADGDVAFAKITPCFQNRKSVIFCNLPNGIGAGTTELKVLRQYDETIDRKYLLYFLKSPYFINEAKFKGTANQQRIVIGYLENKYFPLPPLAEQHRIVERIEEYFPVIKEYGEAYDEASKMDAELPDKLKKSILQEAIKGKLGTQNSDDEPASVLMEQIREEKKRLVKKGVLKKKDLEESPVDEDEEPFKIPDSWKWCRMEYIISLLSGRDLAPEEYNENGNGIPYITGASNFIENGLLINRWTPKPVSISHLNDLLITCKGTIGTMAFNNIGDIHIARQVMAISSPYVDMHFIKYFLMNIVFLLQKNAKSMIPGISRDDILKALVPIPPLAEQHRIVQRIEELYAEIDNMTINKNNNETDIEETEE